MYSHYSQCQQSLADIEEIDFYFACELVAMTTAEVSLDETEQLLWFHILLALCYFQRTGNTCLTLTTIAEKNWFESQAENQSGFRFPDLQLLEQLCAKCTQNIANYVVFNDSMLFTRRYDEFEREIAAYVHAHNAIVPLTDTQCERARDIWPAIYTADEADEIDWQQVATAQALINHFVLVNGGPGTGKTYTVTRIILALKAVLGDTLRIQLAAPTGKAAQRLTESINTNLDSLTHNSEIAALTKGLSTHAVTLHRLLGVRRYGVGTRHHQDQPIDCDVLVIDESSMVDMALMARVIRSLPEHCRLILLGDADQLPSVEAGNVLAELIKGEKGLDTTGLITQFNRICPHLSSHIATHETQLHRYHVTLQKGQRSRGTLAEFARFIGNGEAQDAWALLQPLHQISTQWQQSVEYWQGAVDERELSACARTWFAPLFQLPSAQAALQFLRERRWLSPLRKGRLGAEQLNRLIESALTKSTIGQGFYPGRPIMVVENDYSQQLFNGDVGVVWSDGQGKLCAWFDMGGNDSRQVPLSRLPKVESVFAMTIHKSQGSEFDKVLIVLPEITSTKVASICTREILYTGVTRARSHCVVVGEQSVFNQMVHNQQIRSSGLHRKISSKISSKIQQQGESLSSG